MPSLLLNGRLQFVDSNGDPIAGGQVGYYDPAAPGVLKTVWGDRNGTTVLQNPVPLDAAGRPFSGGSEVSIYGTGQYEMEVSDASGVLQYTTLTNDVAAAPIGLPGIQGPIGPPGPGGASGTPGAPGTPGNIIPGMLYGFTLSNDAGTPFTVLDIAAGTCTDSANLVQITSLGPFTKSLSGPWVAGTGNNGMGTGVVLSATASYHVFAAIISGAFDVFFDTSPTAANAPAGTTSFRRIGSIVVEATRIVRFQQHGDRFDRYQPTAVQFSPTVDTTETRVLDGIPVGLAFEAILSGQVSSAGSAGIYISTPGTDTGAPVGFAQITCYTVSLEGSFSGFRVVTDAAASVYTRVQTATAVNLITNGWIDNRGRLGPD